MTAFKLIIRIAAVTVLLLLMTAPAARQVYAEDFAEYEIPVTCRISDDIPLDIDLDFTYLLEADSEDCPMPKGSNAGKKTVHVTDSGKVDFGKISFDRPEVFHYTLKEITNEKGRFRRDKTEYHTTLVTDTDGNVNMVVNNGEGKKSDKIEFANSYLSRRAVVKRPPKTGDSADLMGYLALLIGSAAMGLMLWLRKRRRGKHDETAGTCGGAHDGSSGESEVAARRFQLLRMIASLGAALIITAASMESAYAADIISTVSDYNQMPGNFVEITPLDFSQAEFTSLNNKIQKGPMEYLINDSKVTHESIYWKSSNAPYFGSSNATATSNASLAINRVSGDLFTLRFSGAAKLPDGSSKDVLMTFSNLVFALSLCTTDTNGPYYYPVIRIAPDGSGRYCNSGIGTSTKNAGRLSGVRSATRIQTTIKIVEPGTNTAIPEKHYILGFRDLDVKDNTTATWDNVDRYRGTYTEGIGLCSGYDEPAYLSKKTYVVQEIVDGVPKFRGTKELTGGIEVGFDISVSSSGFSYYWYGSHNMPANGTSKGGAMSSQFGYSPKVTVAATSTGGGTIEKPGVTEYLVNTSTSYKYTPQPGYRVKSLKVDGADVDFDVNGGTYVFEKLTAADDDSVFDHTIAVVFQSPQDVVITCNVKGTLGDRKKEFSYVAALTRLAAGGLYEISQASTGKFTGVNSNGTYVSAKSFRADSQGRANLKLLIKDDEFVEIRQLPATSTYNVSQAESDHIPSYSITADGTNPVIARAEASIASPSTINTHVETVDPNDGAVTVQFINEKNLAPPTGVRSSRVPLMAAAVMLAVLTAVMAGAVLAMSDRRGSDVGNVK